MSVSEQIAATIANIRAKDPAINAFTQITEDRALARARALDANKPSGPLSGMPFAAKNLFDLQGVVTLAGSKINRDLPPAKKDATIVARLEAAGAVCVGALNMDEYAYGFTTENTHYGPTRNPHDPEKISGGSSGGSAAAVAAGFVPLTLGSDTNGSIRVPSSFCGVWGLKPTYGRLSRSGVFPFVASLDHVGPFASSLPTLAAAYDAMQGPDASDPACAQRPAEPVSAAVGAGTRGLRIGLAAGYFEENCDPAVYELVKGVAQKLGEVARIELPDAGLARAAAFTITASESGALHLPNLRKRLNDFDPHLQDRLLAGALLPSSWYHQAQRVRRACYEKIMRLFQSIDVFIAPATPHPAHRIGTEMFSIRGRQLPARASVGILTQPISSVGLPVICAPAGRIGGMPVGLQVVAAPWREDLCFRVAGALPCN
ncbi:MAG: AtzE family amidohydrolase [Betaproteobacteria bacterium]|nr:AtzE family amidohydrolase [Betaproteobacteria bacterium]